MCKEIQKIVDEYNLIFGTKYEIINGEITGNYHGHLFTVSKEGLEVDLNIKKNFIDKLEDTPKEFFKIIDKFVEEYEK